MTNFGQPGEPERTKLRVLVVARQPVARAGLRGLIEDRQDLLVVGEALNAEDAAQDADVRAVDALLATWDSGRIGDAVALAEVATAHDIPLVLLADPQSTAEMTAILRAGTRGVLLSDASGEEVYAALLATSQGLLVLDPELGPSWSLSLAQAAGYEETTEGIGLALADPLTEREREVLSLLALGLPNKSIAKRLAISEHTVKFHVGSILSKLDAGGRTEAVTKAARRGLLAL